MEKAKVTELLRELRELTRTGKQKLSRKARGATRFGDWRLRGSRPAFVQLRRGKKQKAGSEERRAGSCPVNHAPHFTGQEMLDADTNFTN
jgi:hypothetical protein